MNTLAILPVWVWILISSLFFAVGEFLSKKFALNPTWTALALFLVVDIVSALTWLPAIFEKNQLSVVGVMWSVVSVIATVAIGLLVFHEKVTVVQTFGLVLGLVAVFLLSL